MSKYQIVSLKAVIRVDWPVYFSIINVYLEDINVFARFDEIPSLPVENIFKRKHQNVADGRKDGRTRNLKTV